jgi:alpha-1,3-rhamnosyl/mannosyltransferase
VIRVGVDLLFLRPGEVGGSEEYTVRGLTALAERSVPDLEVTLFVLEAFPEAHPELVAAFPVQVLRSSGRPRPLRVAAESSWLAARTRRLDAVHFAGGTMPAVRTAPGVLTIHDLQPLELPENFSALKRSFIRLAVPRSARAARLVCTPSESARQSVIRLLDVPGERVRVVPHGIDPAPAGPLDVADEQAVRERHELGAAPYFLFPAITYAHKNHLLLVDALARMAHTEALLVLTGGEGPVEDELWERLDTVGVAHRVRRPGRVPRADLDALYRAATGLVFPSRYEGFGNPVAEAMAFGCPVLVADATSLPEVVGDAGMLLPTDDAAAWARAMDRLLDDGAERARLAEAGRARAEHWTWARTAEALEGAYRMAAGTDVGAVA